MTNTTGTAESAATPAAAKPSTNAAGLEKKDYTGSPSTLCTGCGHDSISQHVITACYQSGIHPWDLAKMSGIGCSSKIPAYFISRSFSFNSMHGRMAPITTGAHVANQNLIMLGISGDGDSASIGLGGFAHLIRRNAQVAYIVANNGVYGLTKGQFSATADKGSQQKTGAFNPFSSIDICTLALELGCTFVARSFSGDAKQLVPLLQAALRHKGTAVIDVISPCITFNNHDGSTRSYTYVKEHDRVLQELGFIQPQAELQVDYSEGATEVVELPDGSKLRLKKIDPRLHNLHDRYEAMKTLAESREKGEIVTGLFYIDEKATSLKETLSLTEKPLSRLTERELRPSPEALSEIMAEFR
jgi:2-oxoglutarate ferredoxin oxidoreductase subunit beta